MIYKRKISEDRIWISNSEFFSSTDLQGEEWIDFDNYQGSMLKSGYTISNKGRIRGPSGSIIVGSVTFDGYHEVSVQGVEKSIIVKVHRAVLQCFRGSYPAGMKNPTCQHLNHNKLDNRIENLCWMSSFENNQEGHGVKCKIVDKNGEHEFPSQKVASCYIGRHADYISEGISSNYKLTNIEGEEIEVYTLVDDQWVKHCRSMPNNRHWCKLVTATNEILFESFQQCDSYLNKPEGYTGNIVRNGWPICNDDHKFYIYDTDSSSYILYRPTSKKSKEFKKRCIITDSSGDHIFDSISAAARYIGRDSEYLRIALRDDKVVRNSTGEVVKGHVEAL